MDIIGSTLSRIICGLLTSAAAIVLGLKIKSVHKRVVIWSVLIVLGVVNVLLPIQKRITHSNLAHYYLGAKYPSSYFDFYKIVTAGKAKPQVLYRNLREPDRLFRNDPREQRLYYIGLLNQYDVTHDPGVELKTLEALCASHGLIAREADEILADALPEESARALRKDLMRLNIDTDDSGFNGSPFYALVRKVDPTLYFPFSPMACIVNLIWQIAAVFLMAAIAGSVFSWTRETRLMVVALLIGSWDFTGWALNGLTCGGWLLPVIITLWGYHRKNAVVAGAGIAWAAVMKLFPVVLLLPLGVILIRGLLQRGGNEAENAEIRRASILALKVMFAALCAGVLMVAASSLSGLSWSGFLHKIVAQFLLSGYIVNGVGVSQILLALGIQRSSSLIIPQIMVLLGILWGLWMTPPRNMWQSLPPMSLILLSCMGWLTQTWLNYYALIGLFLLPEIAKRSRRWAVTLVALYAVSFLLPDYVYCYMAGLRYLAIIKVIPHLLIGIVALALQNKATKQALEAEQKTSKLTQVLLRYDRPVYLLGILLSVLVICFELYRVHAARSAFEIGNLLRGQQQWEEAVPYFERAVRLLPRDAIAQFNLAYLYQELQRHDDAMEGYLRTIALGPRLAQARSNLGIIYLQKGKPGAALEQLEQALELAPYDETVHVNTGTALARLGRHEDAIEHYQTALTIDPENKIARHLLEKLGQKNIVPQ